MHGVIDYALGKHKSPRMDVFLCGGCRFYVGVASGISHVPTTFGVPCVLSNWLSNALPVYSGMDMFVPKMLRHIDGEQLLPFDEYLDPDTRLLSYSGQKLEDHDLEVVDNTPDELLSVVVEMINQLDAGKPRAVSARGAAIFSVGGRRTASAICSAVAVEPTNRARAGNEAATSA